VAFFAGFGVPISEGLDLLVGRPPDGDPPSECTQDFPLLLGRGVGVPASTLDTSAKVVIVIHNQTRLLGQPGT
jgi:hypothetical protein